MQLRAPQERRVSILVTSLFVSTLFCGIGNGKETVSAKALIERAYVGGGEASGVFSQSPDGRAIAFAVSRDRISDNEHQLTWHVLQLDGAGEIRDAGDGGDLILNIDQNPVGGNGFEYAIAPKWSPDGQWFAYPRKRNGEVQLWLSSRDGRVQEQATRNRADILGAGGQGLFEWSMDGSKLYYEVARDREEMVHAREKESKQGFLFDERFQPELSSAPFWLQCNAEQQSSTQRSPDECQPVLWTHDLSSGLDRPATTAEQQEYTRLKADWGPPVGVDTSGREMIKRSKDGSIIWFETIDPDVNRGRFALRRVATQSTQGATFRCNQTDCAGHFMQDAWMFEDEVVYLRLQGKERSDAFGYWGFYAWNPQTDAVRRILKTTDYFFGCEKAHGKLICFHETSVQPRRLVTLDIQSGEVGELFNPNPQIAPNMFTKVEHLELIDEDEWPTVAKLVYPRSYRKGYRYPLVIVQRHPLSFGFLDGGTSNEYPVPLFANEGFFVAVISSDVNLSVYAKTADTDNDIKAHAANYSSRSARALRSFKRIIEYLQARDLVDVSRVGATGFSAGSVNVRYAMINDPGIFAATAVNQGYSGPQRYWFSSKSFRELSQLFRKSAGWSLAPPYTEEAQVHSKPEQLGYHAGDIVFPPYLLQVADQELSQALFDYSFLQDNRQPVEMYVFPGERHAKYQPIHRYSVYRRNIQWMKFWLQGEIVDFPMDPKQYDRWTELCSQYVKKLKSSDKKADRERAKRQRCVDSLDSSSTHSPISSNGVQHAGHFSSASYSDCRPRDARMTISSR